MQVRIMLSNHHVHLTQEAVDILFGEAGITLKNYLAGDSGPYACNELVTVEGPKGKLSNVRVLGPCRKYNQVELLKSDCFKLGVMAPLSNSGDLDGAVPLRIIGPCGQIECPCGIIAKRHIHVPKAQAEEQGFEHNQIVKVRTFGERAIVFENVVVHVGGGDYSMHIDTEEGNCADLKNGDFGEIIF